MSALYPVIMSHGKSWS